MTPMPMNNYLINSRQLTACTPLASELIFEPSCNYLFDLSYLASLQVDGEKAQEFLQGQLSCDLRQVNPEQMRQAAMCNLKGRVLALMDVLNWQEQGWQLILPQDLLLETQASLSKVAMFSRVTLKPATQYRLFGFYLQNANDSLPFNHKLVNSPYAVMHQEHYCIYALDPQFYIILVDTRRSEELCQPFINSKQWRGSLAWHALQLQQKRIEIYPESRGLFLPHRLGLHLSGYISFDKGCYKGQEIIARTHYRAKLKHELQVFTMKSDKPLQSGQKLLNDKGELIDFCPIAEGNFLIAASMLL